MKKNKGFIRKKSRRKSWMSRFFFLIVIIFLAYLGVIKSGILNVVSIEVEGQENVKKQEIILRSGLKIGQNFYSVSKKNRIKDINSIPMIKESRISFSLSRKAKIRVEERRPIFQIANYSDYYMLDKSFKIISMSSSKIENLLELKDINSKDIKIGNYLFEDNENKKIFLKKLADKKEVLDTIKFLQMKDNSITFVNKDDILIVFGDYLYIDYKFEILKKVLEDIKFNNKLVSKIDMTVPDSIVVETRGKYNTSKFNITEEENLRESLE